MIRNCSVWLVVIFFSLFLAAKAQIPSPVAYWDFECENMPWLDVAHPQADYSITYPPNGSGWWNTGPGNMYRHDGMVGNYLEYDHVYDLYLQKLQTGEFPNVMNPDGFTCEMLFRAHQPFSQTWLVFLPNRLRFQLGIDVSSLTVTYDDMSSQDFDVNMNGAGRLDPAYYGDGNWHHFAIRYEFFASQNQGVVEVFVDGALIPEFTFPLTRRLNTQGVSELYLSKIIIRNTHRDLDEFIVYDEAIPRGLICRHFQDAMQGNHYCLDCAPENLPCAVEPEYELVRDENEFPIGYDIQNPPASLTDVMNQGLKALPSQLVAYAGPRYRFDKKMPQNQQFVGYDPFLGPPNEYTDVMVELATNWHYSYFLGGLSEVSPNPGTNLYLDALVAQSGNFNSFQAISNWNRSGSTVGVNYPQNLNPATHLKLNSGAGPSQFITFNSGAKITLGDDCISKGTLSPRMSSAPAIADGNYYNTKLQQLESRIGTQVSLILENGEQAPFAMGELDYQQMRGNTSMGYFPAAQSCTTQTTTQFGFDALSINYYHANYLGGIPQNHTTALWREFLSKEKSRLREAYRDALIGAAPNRATFLYYDVGGASPFEYEFTADVTQMNAIASPSGQYHYPTPYFYPQRPQYWFTGVTAALGLRTMTIARNKELATPVPHPYFTPAVSAGYDDGHQEISSSVPDIDMIRPGQYLGLLKNLAVWGGEFFQAFMYHVPTVHYHHRAMYGWQYAPPSYAQAVMSRFEELYYHSNLLIGDFGQTYPDGVLGAQGGYRFWGGNPRFFISARQSDPSFGNTGTYLISASIQNYLTDNYKLQLPNNQPYGISSELEDVTTINLTGVPYPLTFGLRKQGSTYIFDQSVTGSEVFYQLDKWHEYSHPERWSKDIFMEAEVFDLNHSTQGNPLMKIATEDFTGQNISDGDFRNYTTYMDASGFVSANDIPNLRYDFFPKDNGTNQPHEFMVRVRTNGSATGLTAQLFEPNGGVRLADFFVKIPASQTCWTWIDVGSLDFYNLPPGFAPYRIMIQPGNQFLEIDQLAVVSQATATSLSNQGAPFSATVLASPPASICPGESINIPFAFQGVPPFALSFLFDDGTNSPVTMHIRDIQTNNYTFTYQVPATGTLYLTRAGDANCHELRSEKWSIKVKHATTPVIAPGPVVQLCNGQSINLTTGSFNSYQWSDGATTQNNLISEPGNYWVEAISNGCPMRSSCVEVRRVQPEVTLSAAPPVCTGQAFNLSTPVQNVSYTWFHNGSQVCPTCTTVLPANGGGTYSLTVVDANGCAGTTTMDIPEMRPVIEDFGYICTGDNVLDLTPYGYPSGGTWSVGTPNQAALTGNLLDPSLLVPNVPLSLSYTAVLPYNCVGTETVFIEVMANCCNNQALCDLRGANLVPNFSFDATICPVNTSFYSPLNLDCSQSATLNPGNYALFQAFTFSGNTIFDHFGNAGSQFVVANVAPSATTCNLYPATENVWAFAFPSTPGRNYLVRGWINNISPGTIDYHLLDQVQCQPILSGTLSGSPTWTPFCAQIQSMGESFLTVAIEVTPGALIGLDDIMIVEVGPAVEVSPAYLMIDEGAVCTLSVVNPSLNLTYDWCVQPILGAPNFPGCNPGNLLGTGNSLIHTVGNSEFIRVSTEQGGCIAYADAEIFSEVHKDDSQAENGGGINVNPPQFALEAFPNPTQGTVTVRVHQDQPGKFTFRLINMLGTTLQSGSEFLDANGELELDLSGYSKGVYFLRGESANQSSALRLVKQ
ncbi:MAG: T9SS type A sorting domain-containing protein [Bacteroidia bacterium]|nr:T9SS type A sorting domain-containing protein [Bacteroidia bacterium]